MLALMLTFTIVSAGEMVLAFNIEPVTWKYMTQPGESFGYKVIQNDASSVLVSAPVEEVSAHRRGRVYSCELLSCPAPPQTCSCTPLNIDAQQGVNMSLGLWMSKEETTSSMPNPKAVVCGPTITKECKHLNLYRGMCFSISQRLSVSGPAPPTLGECLVDTGMDIAFLLDGSGSVADHDFMKMKEFVINLIDKFINKNTQFAVVQFSHYCTIAINFNDFNNYKHRNVWKYKVRNIYQDRRWTYTAEAINKLRRELFVQRAGNRPKAKKVLLVITDGESNGQESLQDATNNAHRSNIICYAIGVGGYNRYELDMIASEPKAKHVFTVSDFTALDGLKETLEGSIVAIEGTQTSGDSTHMEFAQEGFSAALVMDPEETYLMSAVGAFQWKGMYQEYPASGRSPVSQKIDQMEAESYMGYSMAVATGYGHRYVILGAPRYKHRGQVVVHHKYKTQTMESGQIGAYLGAEVCVVDLDGDSNTDLILASAPMFTEEEREGKVLVYSVSYQDEDYNQKFYFLASVQDTGVSLLGLEGQRGRFGSSLASLADLNGDGIRDVAVGAPLEDNGQGSVYIFNGRRRGINPTYSQRIAGSSVRSGLRFFGLTVAQSALDQSGDGLPDIAVGSKGAVLLLRSRPIVSIATSVTFEPSEIPKSIYDCTSHHRNKASVCFNMTKVTKDSLKGLEAKLNYTLSLDFVRRNSRAFFTAEGTDRSENKEVTVSLGETCSEHSFFVQCSPEDVVTPVDVRVAFSFQGLPIPSADQLTPKLSSSSPITTDHQLSFEVDCGEDKKCIDQIQTNFDLSGTSIIEVGITQKMSVRVMVENRGENSYNTHVSLSYPVGLSYRTFTKSQGRVECSSLDSTDGDTLGKTDCSINTPILQAGHKADFVVQYGIGESSHFGDRITMWARASSDNDEHHPSSQLSKSLDIGVKYSIYVILKSFRTTNYIHFTAGDNHLQKPVIQELEVTNKIRGLNLTVAIHVPVRLQDIDIWTNVDSLQIQGCSRGRERNPNITDLKHIFKDNKEPDVNCSVAVCLEFRCDSYMMIDDQNRYRISGNVSSEWIEQTGLRSAFFHLVSSATLEYDDSKYIFYSTDSSHQPPVSKMETLVEAYEEPDLTKAITGGVVGGLILVAFMTAVLVKLGFFNSQYQYNLQEAHGGGEVAD